MTSGSSRRLLVLSSVLAVVLVTLAMLDRGASVRHPDAPDHITPTSALGTHGLTRSAVPSPQPTLPTESDLVAEASTLRLEGMVVDQRQRPVAGAKVSLGADRTVVTESDGAFAFDDLAEGDYSVIAEWGDAYAESIDTTLDDRSDPVTLALARGPSVHVRVTGQGGEPIAGAMVRTSSRRTKTDAGGNAVLRAVDYESELITVDAETFATSSTRVPTGDDPAATIEHAVVLGEGALIAGIVIDEAGQPVPEAVVDLEQIQGERSERVYADDRGTFTLESIGPGRYALKAKSDDFIAGPTVSVEVDGSGPVRTVIRVVRGSEITGVVVDQHGRPVPEAEVHVGPRWIASQADGTFVARGLEAGEVEVGARTKTAASRTALLQVGERTQREVRIVVEASAISGIVVDPNGVPIAEASVAARGGDPQGYGYATTDEGGRFDLGGLPPGSYELTASRDDSRHEGEKVKVATGTRGVRIMLEERSGLTGTVLLEGAPVPFYGYELLEPSDTQPWSPTLVREGTGTFLDEDVKPGTWTVAIVGPGFTQKLLTGVRIAPGRITDLGTIRVERGRSLRGRVTDAQGTPVAGARVRVRASFVGDDDLTLRTLARGGYVTKTRSDGTYRIEGVGELAPAARLEVTHATLGIGGADIEGREVVDLEIAVR